MLIINPKCGLCNRMQTRDSSLALARQLNAPLTIFWVRNRDCSRMKDLFELRDLPCRVIELREGIVSGFLDRYAKKFFGRFNNLHLGQKKANRLREQKNPVETLSGYRHIYIRTYSRFFYAPEAAPFTPFRPKKSLQAIIDTYRKPNCIGIHIRRGDNRKAIAHCPLSEFIKQMNEELRVDPNVCFFLATDDPSSEKRLQAEFPGKITVHRKQSLDRNSPQAIRDAVIDLYSLANCRKLIGSYWSSFTDTAAEIGGIEKATIHSSTHTPST